MSYPRGLPELVQAEILDKFDEDFLSVLFYALLGEVDIHLQSAGLVHLWAGGRIAIDDLPAELTAIGDGLPVARLADANRDGNVRVDRGKLAETKRRGEFSRGDVRSNARLALGPTIPILARARARVYVEDTVVRARLDAVDFTSGISVVPATPTPSTGACTRTSSCPSR